MRRLILLAAIVAALALPDGVRGAVHRGIAGTVTIGPTCPICGDRPYGGAIIDITGRSKTWAVTSAADGSYSITLLPGTYTVHGRQVGFLPRAPAAVTVRVRGNTVVIVDLRYDTGIR